MLGACFTGRSECPPAQETETRGIESNFARLAGSSEKFLFIFGNMSQIKDQRPRTPPLNHSRSGNS